MTEKIDIDKLKQFLKNLKSFNHQDKNIEDGITFINENKQFIFLFRRNYQKLYRKSFYRARFIGLNENPTLRATHSYPPSIHTKLGRVNFPNQPVFYASYCFTTAILELLQTTDPGEIVYISEWKIRKGSDLPTYPLIPNPYSEPKLNKEIFTRYDPSVVQIIDEIFKTYMQLFILEKNYSFSAAFGNYILYELPFIKMILYPSFITNSDSFCTAINKDYFDENFYLKRVFKVKIHEIFKLADADGHINEKVSLSFLETGRIKDNEIKYGKLTREDNKKIINNFLVLPTEDGRSIRAKDYLKNLRSITD